MASDDNYIYKRNDSSEDVVLIEVKKVRRKKVKSVPIWVKINCTIRLHYLTFSFFFEWIRFDAKKEERILKHLIFF